MTTRGIDRAEEAVGHHFANPELLERALTHASAVNGREQQTYQRLEFLGDRVLGLLIAQFLIEKFPEASEGELSHQLHRLVSGQVCAEVAAALDLGDYMRMGAGQKGKKIKATPGVLADACEAVIAAIYLDKGLSAARKFVRRHWGPRIEENRSIPRDPKGQLQEWAHRTGIAGPSYSLVSRSGPDHKPEFEIEVSVGEVAPARGKGSSKRDAELDAAANILRREGVWEKA